MSIKGSCQCKNIKIVWYCFDYSMFPRACQCEYCVSKNAAYVSKSGTHFDVSIKDVSLHKVVTQGSLSASFHECSICGDIVFVSVEIEGQTYGALNANILVNKFGFNKPQKVSFDGQTSSEKQQRWKNNWCWVTLK